MGLSELLYNLRSMLNWMTVTMVFRFIFDTIKEIWFDVKFYKYEIYVPDWEKEREKSLSERRRRMNE